MRRAGFAAAVLVAGLLLWFWMVRPSLSRGPTSTVGREDSRSGLAGRGRLPPGSLGSMEGVVLDSRKQPVEGARVAVVSRVEVRDPVEQETLSGADGRFRLEGVRPGVWALTATAAGKGPAYLPKVPLAGGAAVTGLELVLGAEGFTVAGTVRDETGAPVDGVRIQAGRASHDSGDLFAARSGADGRYTITLGRGIYQLGALASGYAPNQQTIEVWRDLSVDIQLVPAAGIAGTVHDGSSPAAEAGIRLVMGGITVRDTLADDSGKYAFDDLPPGRYTVVAVRGARSAYREDLALARSGHLRVDLSLAAARTVAGTVHDGSGAGVEGAKIWLQDAVGQRPTFKGESGKGGAWSIGGVFPGLYVASAQADGHAWGQATSHADASKGDVAGVEITVADGARVAGVVLDADGKGVEGAALAVSVGGQEMASDRSGEGGRFDLGDLPSGSAVIDAVISGTSSARAGPFPLAAGETHQVELHLAVGATLRGVVQFTDGTPAGGVGVHALRPPGPGISEVIDQVTSGDGHFAIGGISPGPWAISATRLPGAATPSSGLSAPSAQAVQVGSEDPPEITLQLSRGEQIAGTVVSGGAALPDVEVRVADGEQSTWSKPDGTFLLEDLDAGPHTVLGSKAGYSDAHLEGVPAGTTDLRLELVQGASISGVALSGSGAPLPDYRLAIFVEDPGLPWRGSSHENAVHDASGAFEIDGLVGGSYDLVATAPEGGTATTSVTLGDGERREGVTLQVGGGISLEGQLVDYLSGAPIPGAALSAYGSGPALVVQVDDDGHFRLDGLAPGWTVALFAYADASRWVVDQWTVPLPNAPGTVNVGTLRLDQVRSGSATGVGMFGDWKDGAAVVTGIADGSEAIADGIGDGDRMTGIDGKDPSGLGPHGILQELEGPPGSVLDLEIAGKGSFHLTRAAQ